jgi:hypothetical protein
MTLSTWRKSSFSTGSESDCVEIAWRKSSFSTGSQSNCVEVGFGPVGVAVRDSKNAAGPMLTMNLPAWRALTARLAG